MKCQICNKEFITLKALSEHITKKHTTIDIQQYYDTYINKLNHTTYCPICKSRKRLFGNITFGYFKTCGYKECKYEFAKKNREKTLKDRYNETNCMRVHSIKEKIKSNNFRKTGYEWQIGSPKVRNKILDRLFSEGIDNVFQRGDVIKAIKLTKLNKKWKPVYKEINYFSLNKNDIYIFKMPTYNRKLDYIEWVISLCKCIYGNYEKSKKKYLLVICDELYREDILKFFSKTNMNTLVNKNFTLNKNKSKTLLIMYK